MDQMANGVGLPDLANGWEAACGVLLMRIRGFQEKRVGGVEQCYAHESKTQIFDLGTNSGRMLNLCSRGDGLGNYSI